MKQTYKTKLCKTPAYPTNNLLAAYLDEWSAYFQRIERRLYVDIVFKKKNLNKLKTIYTKLYSINARQFNAIKAQVIGKIDSVKELKKLELEKKVQKLNGLNIEVEQLVIDKADCYKRLNALRMNDPKFSKVHKEYRILKNNIHYKKRKMQEIDNKIANILEDNKNDIVRICFGSKELFRKQYNLAENDFKDHSEWRDAWRNARSNQCMFLGSSDEAFGNSNCQYNTKNTLSIKVAEKFEDRYGNRIEVPNVTFKYGQANIDYCKKFYHAYTPSYNYQKYYYSPMTHRFYRTEHGWYLLTTIELEDKPIITDSRIGAIGVDFNVNFAQLAFVDRFGNPIEEMSLPYVMYGKRSGQIDSMLGDLAKEVCELARYYKVPVYIEDLKLENAKDSDKGRKYNRMINSFPYKKFREALEARGRKTGVKIEAVNPSYTSFIGQFKFMRRYGLSSHGAAAVVIARRGLRYHTEKLSKANKSLLANYKENVNLNRNNYRLWMDLKSAISKKLKLKFNDRIQLLYLNKM